jgi:hypothetical protein
VGIEAVAMFSLAVIATMVGANTLALVLGMVASALIVRRTLEECTDAVRGDLLKERNKR